jgi:hypothetical protein
VGRGGAQEALGQAEGSAAMSEKLCVFCRHMKFDKTAEYDSGGGDACVSCDKNRFNECLLMYSEDGFRELILHAGDCPDYDEAKP